MPQNSSYYTDLQIPTVNSDGSTYGTIINEFLNGLLIKLKDLSDRVTAAQGQLTDINRGTNAVDRINNTFAGVVGSNALVSGSWTTLYPDPYSGSYTKTTTWPAYTSDLTSYSPPTTQSEIENFDYQGFASVLQSKLDLIQGRVDQAEADILNSQINCCRTKKYLDAIDSSTLVTGLQLIQTLSGTIGSVSSSTTLTITNGLSSVPATDIDFWGLSYSPSGATLPIYEFETSGTFSTSAGVLKYSNSTESNVNFTPSVLREGKGPGKIRYSSGSYIITLPSGWTFNVSSGALSVSEFKLFRRGEFFNKPTPNLTSCNSPSPPYFI